MSSGKDLTWKKIVEDPKKDKDKGSVYGVILDSTHPYKTMDSKDFVTKIKIFDSSLNCKNKVKNQEYVYIFIYSETLENSPYLNRIGDIIFLKNIDFSKFDNYIKGTYNKYNSSWILFNRDKNSGTKGVLGSKGNTSSDVNKKALDNARDFSKKFFSENSIENFSWYKIDFPKKITDGDIYEIKDTDIIVKIVSTVQNVVGDINYHKLVLCDINKNIYFSEFRGSVEGLTENIVMKLRSIMIYLQKDERKIEFRSYSNILFFDKSHFNSKTLIEKTKNIKYSVDELNMRYFGEMHLDKLQKEEFKKNIFIYKYEENGLIVSHPILKDFNFNSKESENKNVGSIVKNNYSKMPVTSLEDLKKSISSNKQGDFRVNCHISNVKSNFIDMLQFYSPKAKKSFKYKDFDKIPKDDKEVQVRFNNTITLSNGKTNVDVLLSTENCSPNYFFDLSKHLPSFKDLNSWKKLNKTILSNMDNLLKNMTKKTLNYDLIIKGCGNKKCYCIVDTLLWFLN